MHLSLILPHDQYDEENAEEGGHRDTDGEGERWWIDGGMVWVAAVHGAWVHRLYRPVVVDERLVQVHAPVHLQHLPNSLQL